MKSHSRIQGNRARTRRLAAAALILALPAAGCAHDLLAHGSGGEEEASCMRMSAETDLLVTWHRTAPAEERVRLDHWCASVGPAVIARPGSPERTDPPIDSLVVVSWNVHVGGGDLLRLVGDLRAGRLTGGAPVQAFVLLVQEAYRSGSDVPPAGRKGSFPRRIEERPPGADRIDVVEVADRLGLHVLYAPSMRNGEGAEDRGNAILSSLPLAEPEAIELPFEVQRRVAVAGTVQGIDAQGRPWSIRMVSAHLDHRSTLRRFWASFGEGRARQARALADAVEQDPAIIGADLNSWSPAFLESALPLLTTRFPTTPPGPGATYTAAGILPRALDHILIRLPGGRTTRVHRVADRYGSDHHPLVTRVRVAG